MPKIPQSVVIVLMGIIIFILIYLLRNQYVQTSFMDAAYKSTHVELKGTKKVLEQKINELGQQETKIKVLSGNNEQLTTLLQQDRAYMASKFRQFEQDFGAKLKNLHSITNLRVTTSGQFVTVTRDSIAEKIVDNYDGEEFKQDTIRETLKVISFKEPNGWFEMKGTICGNTMNFVSTYHNEFDMAAYSEKRARNNSWIDWPKFMRRKVLVAKVIDRNPYSKTKSFEHIVQTKKRNKRLTKELKKE